jgi:hypothetical protein
MAENEGFSSRDWASFLQ